MQDLYVLITAKEEQKLLLLRCVQEHKNLFPDGKKEILNREYRFFNQSSDTLLINIFFKHK